jgi:transposase
VEMQGKISKKGDKHIRKTLYFPTFAKTKEKYERIKEKKRIPMIVTVAQQRKWLGLMYILW